MRVIAGLYKGRALQGPDTEHVRPTIDRVKEAIFGSLQFQIPQSNILDLFAGSGALGIECISRGANLVYFVDSNKSSLDLVKKNLCSLKVESGFSILLSDFLYALKTLNGKTKFDIILIDAPFASDYATKAIEFIDKSELLNIEGKIVWERLAGKRYPVTLQNLSVDKLKKYGTIEVALLSKIKI